MKEIVGGQQKTATEGHTDAQQQLMVECVEKIIQGWTTRDEGGEEYGKRKRIVLQIVLY